MKPGFTATHRHYKGGLYQVLFIAMDADANAADVVVYQGEDGNLWTRHKAVFDEILPNGIPRYKAFGAMFPIMGKNGGPADPRQVPLAMLLPHAEQAGINHGQTLQRLAERGGFSWCEAAAVLQNRRWEPMDQVVARGYVLERVAMFHRTWGSPLPLVKEGPADK